MIDMAMNHKKNIFSRALGTIGDGWYFGDEESKNRIRHLSHAKYFCLRF